MKPNKNTNISRIEFEKSGQFLETDILANPFDQFAKWWQEAAMAHVYLIDAVTLATVDEKNHPDIRVVLLKDFNDQGMIFFTNYQSKKAHHLDHNPYAAMNIFWPSLERQIRIRGKVSKTSRAESESYFTSRPRGAQIGAWVSPQSQVIENRLMLEKNYETLINTTAGKDIDCPAHWGGFRLIPDYFEFWQGQKNRLHDRICFISKDPNQWQHQRLAP